MTVRQGSTVSLGFALTLALCVPMTREATAGTINYSFTGSGSGTIGSTTFTNASFAVSIDADTADVGYQDSLGALGVVDLSGTISISGVGVATITESLFVYDSYGFDFGEIGFGSLDVQGNLITIDEQGVGLENYDLISNFGPIVGRNLTLRQFQLVATDLGYLSYTSMSDTTFVAKLSAVPEPSALLLSAIGFVGILGYVTRRRRMTGA
jgi:hypothetical protein